MLSQSSLGLEFDRVRNLLIATFRYLYLHIISWEIWRILRHSSELESFESLFVSHLLE